LTIADRNALLEAAIPIDPVSPRSRRYNVRRTLGGLEIYEAKFTEEAAGTVVFHGHPATYVPAKVLRQFRDQGLISAAEYRRLVKGFGSP
jgi:hypothetical protein